MMESVYSLRGFLYKRVYYAQKVYSNSSKAVKILEDMHQFFTTNPHEFYLIWEKGMRGESLEREVCDFIAGMTDRYAISLYEKLFMPKPWQEVR